MSKTTVTASSTSTKRPTAMAAKTRRARSPQPAASVGELERDPIDYEPALAAVGDLFTWAFDLAEKNVRGWRAGKQHVKRSRRYLRALLRGREPFGLADEQDLSFTAGLLIRIFDEDLGLGLGAVASIFESLGLSTDALPTMTQRPVAEPPISKPTLAHLCAILHALSPVDAEAARMRAMRMTPAERAQWIARLSQMTVPMGASLVRAHLRRPNLATPRPQSYGVTPRVYRVAA